MDGANRRDSRTSSSDASQLSLLSLLCSCRALPARVPRIPQGYLGSCAHHVRVFIARRGRRSRFFTLPPFPSPSYSVSVLLPFSQQVVDKVDDDAWGLSAALPVGVEASSLNADSDASAATKLGLVIGLCAGGE